jgi:hypothetical protein
MGSVGPQNPQVGEGSANLQSDAFTIGRVSIEVSGHSCADVTLVPSLQPFRSCPQFPDIHLQIEWTENILPLGGESLFDSGSVWRLNEQAGEFLFDFSAPTLGSRPYKRLFVDKAFRAARLQMSVQSFARSAHAVVPLEYPLDELLIMHRLTQEKAIELHGAGIVRADGVGNLFVGHSGAGKSTTTRLWTSREGVEVLSDDRIIVRRDDTATSSAKGLGRMRIYGTPWHGEARYASPGDASLERIFVLEHGSGNVLTRLSPSQAVAELFARSFVPFHRHEYVDSALEFLQEVVDAVPVYRYAFEPDQHAVDTVLNFHD